MKKQYIQLFSFLCFPLLTLAQTVNEGMLYVGEGTAFSTVERFDNLSSGAFYNDGETFIYSHFNNDGVLDFYENTGVTNFMGTANQNVSGTQISYLYNVLFNNSSNLNPFHLSGEINISGTTDFYDGIVDNDNYGGQITFNTNGSHVNTSDNSHVDGSVNKFGDLEFTFPIGDGGYYRFAGISAPGESSALFDGKFYFENSNNLHSHVLKEVAIEEIDNAEYWIINKVNNNSENGLITLSWRDVTTPSSMIEAAQQDALTIVRWDETTNMWVDEGGVINTGDQTITTSANNYGVFTLGRLNSDLDLPCELIVYNYVTPNGDGKNDYFIIEQSYTNCARNLNVQVYNRWGVKVFETDDYGEKGNVFNGHSSGRLTIKDSDVLPASTYYYIANYQYGSEAENKSHKQAGFLYLSDN
ncbi:gliding motility-associated C-terminal domain-containing protein [Formosa sp. PL04]|uniref:gliding motility-associated C-terminal domain-containing protein n=1 Tax=Formosa sp. PL04 TaxID=3081755 RepID=UPI0029823A2A|nr:gliding motility-associated C-terminal domain-containing protein [Formosa sp. PL04]MDW5289142.1 gliding motility-associated C-terminal domain-containing protein [Formosa sp. PL04]